MSFSICIRDNTFSLFNLTLDAHDIRVLQLSQEQCEGSDVFIITGYRSGSGTNNTCMRVLCGFSPYLEGS